MIPIEHVLLGAAALLLFSVLASKASSRLGIPALLVFMAIGMLAGSDGPGGIAFDDHELARNLGIVALAFILFSGGLDTRWAGVRQVLGPGVALSTVGVLATALVIGAIAVAALDFSLSQAVLLGAIVSSTDAAAVFGVLRSRGARLPGRLTRLLELESGSNDPMAVFLTLGMIAILTEPGATAAGLLPSFVQQMALGGLLGYGFGLGAIAVINRARLEYDGLYPVLTIGLVMLVYAATESVGGNGFLAVYIAGLVIGNRPVIHRASILRFHDGIAWLMQITMFLALGLLVFPSRLPEIMLDGLILSAGLIFVARPIGVFLCLTPLRMPWRETTLIAWVGLRGAVPIILATFPLLADAPRAQMIFDLVFFIVLTSVLVQGTTLPFVARILRLHQPAAPREDASQQALRTATGEVVDVEVSPRSDAAGRRIVEVRLPDNVVIVLLRRGQELIIPTGGTVLRGGDVLSVAGEEPDVERAREQLGTPQEDA